LNLLYLSYPSFTSVAVNKELNAKFGGVDFTVRQDNCARVFPICRDRSLIVRVDGDVYSKAKLTSDPRGVGAQFGNAVAGFGQYNGGRSTV
jgi:hypothetical protein